MGSGVATITKWIVVFLVIFLLCMILVLSFFKPAAKSQGVITA
ncbi:hypothetical protein [Ferroacidibacillus organovorans]|nr:hypothetical protein [Ferroacidibacillus organovorans]